MPSVLWVVLLLVGFQGRGQAPINTAPTRGSIEGVVIRAGAAVDIAPLANVQVELKPGGMTASTGKFVFRNLPAGRYTLSVKRDGFMLQEDPKHGLTPTGMIVTLAAGQALKDVVLPMIPMPAISGRVYDPGGEPLAAAVVQAYARRYTPYGPQLKAIRKVLSDDLGEYRLYWLNFGEYVIGASYGDRVLRSALGAVHLSANVPKQDDGYTTVFYGRASSASQADTVRVAPGIEAGSVNIPFGDVPRFKVQGRLVSAAASFLGVSIFFASEGTDLVLTDDPMVKAGAGGSFELRGVSPGRYVLLAASNEVSSDLVPMIVTDRNVENFTIPMNPTVRVGGRISGDGRGAANPNMSGVQLSLLRSSSQIDQRFNARLSADGTFTIADVGQGEYDVLVESLPATLYIKSIQYGRREIPAGRLRIGNDPNARLDIALGVSSGVVGGHVMDRAGFPAAGTQVVLVPEQAYRLRPDRYIAGYTDAMGNFQLTSVPPGRYTAFAFERIEPYSYYAFAYDPRVESRFGDRGEPVTIGETGDRMLELKLVPASETAGGLQ